MAGISLSGVARSFGRVPVVDDVTVDVGDGELFGLIGPSGCGKTTVLNMVAGLLQPSRGSVTVGGRPVTGPGPDRGVVFQDFALLPWLDVEGNVAFGPSLSGLPKAEVRRRTAVHIDLVGLRGWERSFPAQLSGGMKQRVALARALANDPDVLLMDEPFGSVDALTRRVLEEELLRIWETTGCTVLFVTHDIDEAILLCDRIGVMSGRPSTLVDVVDVDLPRPRRHSVLRTDVAAMLKERLLSAVGHVDQAAAAASASDDRTMTLSIEETG